MPKRCQAPSFQLTLTLGLCKLKCGKVGESENNKISLQTCTRSEGPVRVTDNPFAYCTSGREPVIGMPFIRVRE